MASNLTIRQGVYDPSRRFSFKNIDTEPFTFSWDSNPITVQPGEVVELPHYLAVTATGHLVDKIMIRKVKIEEDEMKVKTMNPHYRSPHGASLGVPAVRETYEKQILTELPPMKGTDAKLQVIRASFKDQLVNDMKREPAQPIASLSQAGIPADPEKAMKEFEGLNIPSNS